jgi:hypothetical protein
MTPDAAYLGRADLAPAQYVRRAGQWVAALTLLPPAGDPTTAALRAEILVEQHTFQLTPPAEAIAAVRALPESALATLLLAQLEYWRQGWKLDGDPIMADPVAGFADAATDPGLAAWATFHHAISTQNLRDDPATAADGFARALELSNGEPFLESYVVRHQGDQLINRHGQREAGIASLRRSLYLRAALGARPQVAAAALTLAGELPPGPEADELRDIARQTARELEIPWLQS